MGDSPWIKISSKRYEFSGKFAPKDIYEHVKDYMDDKLYDLEETELEWKSNDKELMIFTHLMGSMEYTRRHHIRIAFSINMDGKIIDKKNEVVEGNLVLSMIGYLRVHPLIHGKETPLVKFMTKFYDLYIKPSAFENAVVKLIIEMGQLMAEVKNNIQRR